MFIKLMNQRFLMSPEADISGGGAGDNKEKASGDQSQKSVTDDVEKLKAELEAIKKNKEEILSEKKKLSEELNSFKKQNSEAEKKKLHEEKNFEKLLQIELEAKKELMDKLELIERTQTEEKTKLVKTQMWSVFQKELGAELHNQDLANSLVDWSKFVADEKSKYGFNEDGIKQAVNEFRTKHSYLLKSGDVKVPSNAAKSTGENKGKSFAERMAEQGSFIKNK